MTGRRGEEMKQYESLIRDWRICIIIKAGIFWENLKRSLLTKTGKVGTKGVAWDSKTARSVKGNLDQINDQESRERSRRKVKIHGGWEMSNGLIGIWDLSHERKLN